MDRETFESEAQRLLVAATEEGIVLRILGAVAFSRKCPVHRHLRDRLGRHYTDVDFAAYGKDSKRLRALLARLGYQEDPQVYVDSEGSRLVAENHEIGMHLDVFLDKLEFCHTVPWKGRLEIEPDTIPLAELLMQKMQIVEINEKDLIDTMMLLLEYPLGDGDDAMINIGLVARVCARDWGWWRTLTMNLEKVRQMALHYDELTDDETARVNRQVDAALERVNSEPKATSWRLRAKIGDRKKWYRDVGELAPVEGS